MRRALAAISTGALVLLVWVGASPVLAHENDGESADLGIKLLHAVPGLSVDLEIGGGRRYKSVEAGVVIFLSEQPAEDLHLVFKASGTDEILLEVESPELPESDQFTLLFNRSETGDLLLTSFVNDTSPLAPGTSRLIVRYPGSGPTVDMKLADQGTLIIDGISPADEAELDLPVGPLDIVVVATEADRDTANEPVPLEPVVIDLTEGDAVVVYVLGHSNGESIAVAVDTVHDVEIDETAIGPTDLASALDRGSWLSTIPLWVHLVLAGAVATGLAFLASSYARRQERISSNR